MNLSSRLLIDQNPTMFQGKLALAIGLNEAIILQQLHYWVSKGEGGKEYEGRHWVYNTYEQWQEQFPWWSVDTIQRVFKRLRALGVILATDKINKFKMERTLWYAIDYDALEALSEGDDSSVQERAPQNAIKGDESDTHPVNLQERASQNASLLQHGNLLGSITLDYQETTKQKNTPDICITASSEKEGKSAPKKNLRAGYSEDFEAFWALYGRKGCKSEAAKEWEKFVEAGQAEEVMNGVASYLLSRRVRDGYKLDAERFIKRRVWENPTFGEDDAPPVKLRDFKAERADAVISNNLRVRDELIAEARARQQATYHVGGDD